MSKTSHTITLKSKETERLVKRLATVAFIGVRSAMLNTGRIPKVLAIAATDIQEAWRDSANRKS